MITVSKGKLIEQSITISVRLPKTSEQANVTATLDDTTVFTGTCTLDGDSVEIPVRGHEATSVFKFFVDGKLIYKCNVNFTSSPVSLSNETTYEYVDATTTTKPVEYTIPNVVGDTYAVAMAKLKAAGFKNIISEGSISGTVVKIEPASGVSVSPDVQIKITFGGGSEY